MDLSITSTLIGSMGSINTALTAMGVNDLQAKQEAGEQKAAALSASQEVAKLRQTKQDARDLVRQAKEMSTEGGTIISKDEARAVSLGRQESEKDAEAVLSKYYPKLYEKARKGGVGEDYAIKRDIQKYIDDLDKNGYTGSFEAYHARAVKQRARDDLQRKKDRARRERMNNG